MTESVVCCNEHLEYLKKINFEKHLKNINKKLKNKKIILYCAGIFCETIIENFDLTNLNIIGIADRKFTEHQEEETVFGYKVLAPGEMAALKPDYVLVATSDFLRIMEEIEVDYLKGTKIKIKPLIRKPFKDLCKDFMELLF